MTDHSREYMSQPPAHVRLRRPGDPLVDVRRAPRVPRGRRAHAEPRLVRRAQRDPARRGRLGLVARPRRSSRRWRASCARRWTRARSGCRRGSSSTPAGRRATTELARLNAVAGEYDGIYTSHVRNRDAGTPRRDRRVPRRRPGRRDPRRDLAPERPAQHRGAGPRVGAGGRADGVGARGGNGRPRGHDAVPSTASASSPGSCRRGSRPTAARPRSHTCAIPRPDDGSAPSATVTGASSTRASGSGCASRRARSTPTGTGSRSRRSPTLTRKPIRGTASSTCSPTQVTPTRASSSSAGSSPTSTWPR